MSDLQIDPDITRAHTLPSEVYREPRFFELARERVFARSWQLVADSDRLRAPGQVLPFTLLEGCLDEPLLLARDRADRLRCLSNVCTHRGNLVVESEGVMQGLRCRYHGRRFGLDGRLHSMPEFEGVEGFPCPQDHLPEVELGSWNKLLFVALEPPFPLEELIGEMRRRLAPLRLGDLTFDPSRSRDYLVQANWALYVDNYLEGFHIPYVHAGLAEALDYGAYRTELLPWGSLQLGIAKGGEDAFDAAPGQERVAAYYYWLFPNTMINVYPWGISVNVAKPLGPQRTRVSFLSYVGDPSRLQLGAGAELDRVEREDEVIVESVQLGVGSRLYRRGRYSPARETGVHHFHRLLLTALGSSGPGGADEAAGGGDAPRPLV